MRNPCRPGLTLMIGIAALSAPAQTSLATPVDPEILERIGPPVINPGRSKKDMIEMGRKLFFEETFEGNGRTCGTCHPATNNFTVDEEFIRTLDPDDPLFGDDVPGLEVPGAPEIGLFLEHLDGFKNPDGTPRPGVLRGVPHNLSMRTSMTSELPGVSEATGWSGDGSPTGTLQGFAIGAVVQHFTRSVDRVPDEDFRLPTPEELAAIEAFILSVGRQEEVDLNALSFSDPDVEEGRLLFMGQQGINRSCIGCHTNAGAENGSGININRDTRTRLQPLPFQGQSPLFGPDGGFGAMVPGPDGGFGDGTMNTPPLIEAADTPPFFHNNSAETLEDAIRHYTSLIFAQSPAGNNNPFVLDSVQVDQIGAVLRVLNAMENIRYGNIVSEQAQRTVPPAAAMERVKEVVAETEDAIQVLTTGSHPANGPLDLYPDAVALLEEALRLERQASSTVQPPRRNALLREAASLKREASAVMVE